MFARARLVVLGLTACAGASAPPDDTDPPDTDRPVPTDTRPTDDDTDRPDTDTDTDTDDVDRDGVTAADGDCDDLDPNRRPGAPDLVGDGIDQDCDGTDGRDADGDGSASLGSLGDDCNDADPTLHGLDTDGDGLSWCDADCDDGDPSAGAIAATSPCARVDAVLALPGGAAAGEAVYLRWCRSCHNPDGVTAGIGPGLAALVPGETDAGLVRVVLGGQEDMAALPGIGNADVADLLAWLRATWGGPPR